MTGREVITALKKAGFEVARIRGSHHFLIHSDGRRTVVPVHSNTARVLVHSHLRSPLVPLKKGEK
ncbi:MAG: type II toxin-antitoxin system HicA family toxin [Nostoc sp.]|uniref:type II toxin-antitoxin system HicA family toxin n=1 Tax=Nostoc sp. TaxID=1180 RepID=UPI002FF6A101